MTEALGMDNADVAMQLDVTNQRFFLLYFDAILGYLKLFCCLLDAFQGVGNCLGPPLPVTACFADFEHEVNSFDSLYSFGICRIDLKPS